MSAVAVVPVRDGVVPAGADETISEAAGWAVLAGTGLGEVDLSGIARRVTPIAIGAFEPGRWATVLADVDVVASAHVVILPGSPDGRDLAPRLAHALQRPLFAGATHVTASEPDGVALVSLTLARSGGRLLETHVTAESCVVTLQPGVRGTDPVGAPPTIDPVIELTGAHDDVVDARPIEVLAADASTVDLSEAPRIVGAGAGLDGPVRMTQLATIARHLDAAVGATRVVTDRSWLGHERQIGTTGVVVDPELYVAFGVSGAVQHTSGLGDPAHIVSVNTDPHCPMMQMADLALVSDANAVLDELVRRLEGAP